MKHRLLLLALCLTLFTLSGCASDSTSTLPVAEFVAKLKSMPDAKLIDVRTTEEYMEGHIGGAIMINVMDDSFNDEIKGLDKSEPVFLYCLSGKRSNKAATIMREAGFKQVYSLKGGYPDLVQAGLK